MEIRMQVDILNVMKETFHALGVQTVFLKPPYENIGDIDLGLANQMYVGYHYQEVVEKIEKMCEPNKIYITQKVYPYSSRTFSGNVKSV